MDDKWEDCLYCICLECSRNFGTEPSKCEFSDCEWCEGEQGEYTNSCYEFIRKGGSYGKRS